MKIPQKSHTLAIFILIIFIYIGLVFLVHNSQITGIFYRTEFSFYNYLVNAFIHGRLNVISPNVYYDLSLYHNRYFLYWGPAPALFIFPFYLVSRIQTSDVFYTMVAGISNIVLFYFVILEAVRFFKLKLSYGLLLFIVANFAFLSPNLNLSLEGRIWHTSQIIAVFYLLFSYLFYFKFLNNKNKSLFFVISLLFFSLACLSRLSLFVNVFLFCYPFVIYRKEGFGYLKKLFFIFVLSVSAFFIFFAWYNYARFGNIFETGARYQLGSGRYIQDIKKGKFISIDYLTHNIEYELLNPFSISLDKPYLSFNKEGTSIFLVYPFLLVLIYFIGVKIKNITDIYFLRIAGFVSVLSILTILLYLGTGWQQFGSRYFFDIIPLLFLLSIFIIERVPLFLRYAIFSFGLVVNITGVFWFYGWTW